MKNSFKRTLSVGVVLSLLYCQIPNFNYKVNAESPSFSATQTHINKLFDAMTISKTPTAYGQTLTTPTEGKILFGGSKYFVVNRDGTNKELSLYCQAPYLYYPFFRKNITSHTYNGSNSQNSNRYKFSDINAYLTGDATKTAITDSNACYTAGAYGKNSPETTGSQQVTLKKYDGTDATSFYNDFFKGSREVDWKTTKDKIVKTRAYANDTSGSGSGATLVTNPDEVQTKFYLPSGGCDNNWQNLTGAKHQVSSADVNNDISISSDYTSRNSALDISRKYWPKAATGGYTNQYSWCRSAWYLDTICPPVENYASNIQDKNMVVAFLAAPAVNLDLGSVFFASVAESDSTETKKFEAGYNYDSNKTKNVILTLNDTAGDSVTSSVTPSNIVLEGSNLKFDLSAAPNAGEYVAALLDNGTDTELLEVTNAQSGTNSVTATILPTSDNKMNVKILVCKDNLKGIYDYDGADALMQDGSLKVTNYKIRYAKSAGEVQANCYSSESLNVGKTSFIYGDISSSSDLTSAFQVTSNSGGTLSYMYKIPGGSYQNFPTSGCLGVGTYTLQATQEASGYYLNTTITADFSINKKDLTITGLSANNKVYDGSTAATIAGSAQLNGAVPSEVITVNTGTANFADKNAGTNKDVSFSEFTVSGSSIANYNLVQPSSVVANITSKALTINLAVNNKPYDGLNAATYSTLPSLVGVLSGDNVSLNGGVPTFSSINIGDQIPIDFSIFSISGTSSSNYILILPIDVKANITSGFTPLKDTHYTLSAADGANGWYTSNNFIITAANGYLISSSNTDSGPWVNNLTYSDNTTSTDVNFYIRNMTTKEISIFKTEQYKKDNESPTGEIRYEKLYNSPEGTLDFVLANMFKSFLETTGFKYFFKEYVNCTLYANDSISGVNSVEYLKVSSPFSTPEEAANSGGWVQANSFTVSNNEKFITYARITDKAGNISIINSDGIVVYTDSKQNTSNIEFIKTSPLDVTASVNLNGNTINTIKNSDQMLTLGQDYTINGSVITFKYNYLDSLQAGEYALTLSYNPLGETYVTGPETPSDTQINLKINKSNQAPISMTSLSDTYTYGCSPITLATSGGSGNGSITYSSSNSSISTVNGDTLTVIGAGSVDIIVTKAGDDNYNAITFTKSVVINRKSVTISGISASNKTYDGTDNATINGISGATILGKISGDDLTLNSSNALAKFQDKNYGINKRVDFSGFLLVGAKANNYDLSSQPASVSANISKLDTNILGISAQDKIYDGTTTAVVSGSGVVENKINNDQMDVVDGVANFNDKNVGNGKVVTFSEFTLSGADEINYRAIQPSNTTANISKKKLTVELSIKDKAFDNLTTATYKSEPTLVGAVSYDDVILCSGTPTFSSSEIGNNIAIEFTPFSITGNDSMNYDIIQPSSVHANIVDGFIAEPGVHYLTSVPDGENDWFRSNDFVISAVDGYALSTSKSSESWLNKLTFNNETAEEEVIFFVKNLSTLEISSQASAKYKLDKTSPTGEIKIGTNSFKEFLNTITFGMLFKETVDVSINSSDNLSGISSIKYYTSENPQSMESIGLLNENEWIDGDSFSISPDNKLIVYAKLTDNAGNITYINSDGIILTVTPVSLLTNTNFIDGQWNNLSDSKIDVEVSHVFPVISSVSYKIWDGNYTDIEVTNTNKVNFTIDNLPDGDYQVEIRAVDKLNNEISKSVSVKKDTVKPIVEKISKSTEELTNQDVSLSVQAADALSDIANKGYSFDGGITWESSSEHYYSENTTVAPKKIMIKDNAGNISEYEDNIIIDNIDKLSPYIVTLDGSSNEWTNQNVTFNVTALDQEGTDKFAESMIDYFEYSTDSGQSFKKANWSDSHNFIINKEGDYTNKILVKVTDKAGNVSDLSLPYTSKLDKTAPIIEAVTKNTENWTNKDVILTVNAKDDLSGLAAQAYTFDNGFSWQTSNQNSYAYNKTIPGGFIQVKDTAGNVIKYESEIIIDKIDKTPPSAPTVEGASDEWKNEDVTLNVVSDEKEDGFGSGIDYFDYSLDGGKTFNKVEWRKSHTFTITQEGDYTKKILVRLADKSGNISNNSNAYTVKINKSGKDIEEFNSQDSETGIWACAPAGVFGKGYKLIIKKEESGTEEYNQIYQGLDQVYKNASERLELFEIHVEDKDGNIVQPDTNYGLLTLRIPVPEDFDLEDLEIYRVLLDLPDNEINEYVVNIGGENYCEFKTNHLSYYTLIDESKNNVVQFYSLVILIVILILFALSYYHIKNKL